MSRAIRKSMIPPAMRKASRLTPSAPRNALPNSAKANSSAAAIPTDRNAMDGRWAAGAPAVRLANMGAQTGDRKRDVEGKRESVSVDLGGGCRMKKKRKR